MPFLRFSRDKRGYETTALVEPVRHQNRPFHRILYLFRTPPGVKVGRPALDEDAIRWIEAHNPDIVFDWPKILAARPPPSEAAIEAAPRRRREAAGRQRRSDVSPQTPAPARDRATDVETPADSNVEDRPPGLDDAAQNGDVVPLDELVEALEESAVEATAVSPPAAELPAELHLRRRKRRRRRRKAAGRPNPEPGTGNEEPGT